MGCDIAYICVATTIYMAGVISSHKNGCVSEPVANIFHPTSNQLLHLSFCQPELITCIKRLWPFHLVNKWKPDISILSETVLGSYDFGQSFHNSTPPQDTFPCHSEISYLKLICDNVGWGPKQSQVLDRSMTVAVWSCRDARTARRPARRDCVDEQPAA